MSSIQLSDEVLARLVQDSPIGIVVSTFADGRMLEVNDNFARFAGYTPDELIGQTSVGIGLWADPTRRAELIVALRGGQPLREVDVTICTKCGEERQMLATVSEVTIDGRACLLTQVVDVTAHRQVEQLQDAFLALIAHELRPPLTAIQGDAQLLAMHPGLDATFREELLNDVVAESERLDRLLSHLLTAATIMAGRLRGAIEPVLMEPLVERVASTFGHLRSTHSMVVEVTPDLPPAAADPALLEEALVALYENAIVASPHGGTIHSSVVAEAATIVMRITDAGIGIAPQHLPAVSKPFQRASGDNMPPGMGRGLDLSRMLVEAQGGSLVASSPGLGDSITVTITLPIAHG